MLFFTVKRCDMYIVFHLFDNKSIDNLNFGNVLS